MEDVAWQDQIDDQIIDVLLPLRTDDMYLFIKNPTATRIKIVSCSVQQLFSYFFSSKCLFSL